MPTNKRTHLPAWNGHGYKSGDNWIICDICGLNVRASKSRYNHNGLLVCPSDWEPRHPVETIKHKKEKIVPDKVRVEQTDVYIDSDNPITADDL